MSKNCENCTDIAIWEIKITRSGAVDSRYETVYSCDNCKNSVTKVRSSGAEYKRL